MTPGKSSIPWTVLVATSMWAAPIGVPVATAVPADRTAPAVDSIDTGLASYYADQFNGRPTASGEVFDMRRLTAAHRSLPFGTRVRVTNMENGRTAIVKINDRGPFVEGRVLDLSLGAARVLRMIGTGVGPVRLEVLPRMARIVRHRPAPRPPYEPYALRFRARDHGDRDVPRFFAAHADELERGEVDVAMIAPASALS